MDRVLIDYQQSTKNRYKYPVQKYQGITENGERNRLSTEYQENLPLKVRPDNVFRFPTAASSKDNHIKHPAPFHKELPSYFINLLTDEGDVVLDVFSGIGTTGLGCKDRTYIGFEMNEKYSEFSKKRLMGEEWL
jgi:DNA modification methylase